MLVTNKLTLWLLTSILSMTTLFFNLYIFLTSFSNYKKKKQWTPNEIIMVALSLANMAHQLVSYFWMSMDELDHNCVVAQTPYAVLLVITFSLKFTVMWDSSFLTFYYSTKLVSTPNRRYTRFQAAIIHQATLGVFAIPLSGLGTCLPMLVVFHAANDTRDNRDCGVLMPDTTPGKIYEGLYLVVADVLPGILVIKCCISISGHLAAHLRRMKASANGARVPKSGSQMRVIEMALSLVAVFLLFLVVDLYVNYQIAVHHENAITLTLFFISIYTTLSAVLLIYGKKSLWKALIHDFKVCIGACPCLTCLRVPEQKDHLSRNPAKIVS
ncbi:taste receptor, type 2, member 202 [Stigmatopora nigra]